MHGIFPTQEVHTCTNISYSPHDFPELVGPAEGQRVGPLLPQLRVVAQAVNQCTEMCGLWRADSQAHSSHSFKRMACQLHLFETALPGIYTWTQFYVGCSFLISKCSFRNNPGSADKNSHLPTAVPCKRLVTSLLCFFGRFLLTHWLVLCCVRVCQHSILF